jgi:hypothetical protein
MTCKFLPDKTGKTFFANGLLPVYSNIVQSSNYKNCHLIAALSSLAWINNNFFSPAQNAAVCNFTFYDPNPNLVKGTDKGQYPQDTDLTTLPVKVPVSVNTNIFMDDQTGYWCQASSKLPETWPALWEKAFAKFCMFKIARNICYKDLANSAAEPDFSTLPNGSSWGGNPSTCLWYLTGRGLKPYPYTTFNSFKLSSAEIYKFIRSLCVTNRIGTTAAGIGTYNGAKTKYPMGAWTYQNAASAKTTANVDITYQNATITADHCYSILGIYEDNIGQYIVLRNPYGTSDPSQIAVGKGPWIYYDTQNAIGNIFAAGKTGKAVSFDFTTIDGIFALDVKVFSQYFEGFGYIA